LQGGKDLFGHVTSHEYPYTERDVRDLMAQLCSALDYIHTKCRYSIVHRNVKPENCIVSIILCSFFLISVLRFFSFFGPTVRL